MRCVNDSNLTDQLYRENNRVVHQTLSLLSGLGSIIIGTLMSWGVYRLNYVEEFTATTLFFGVLGALLLVMFRFTTLSGIGTVIHKSHVIDHVLYIFWVILAFMGPVLVPIIALAVFGPLSGQAAFIWVGFGIIVLGYIGFLFRALLVSLQEKGIGPLNLIYYFCALEIMPVLVAYRTLLS